MPTLTQAPLPSLRNLVAAMVHDALPDYELSAPWRRSGDEAFWFSRSAWSLLAIAKLRHSLTGQGSITVWLPDFFCNSSLIPLRSMGVRLEFYPLTDIMAPDLNACRALAKENLPDLFVLVHFFGQPTPTEDAAAFCGDIGSWLIEDATHVLRPISGIGEHGDFVLYSPHKHLPIPDGAVLIVSKRGPAKLATQTLVLRKFQEVRLSLLDIPGFSNHPAKIWLVKRVLQRLGVSSWRRSGTLFLTDAGTTNTRVAHPMMSPMAKRLLSGQLDILDMVACLRHRNRQLWVQLLIQSKPQHQDINPVPAENTPYLAVFAFDNEVEAGKVFQQWQRAGVPVTTWPDLPPEIMEQTTSHQKAIQLRKTRVYLPVHQSLNPCKISYCARRLNKKERYV